MNRPTSAGLGFPHGHWSAYSKWLCQFLETDTPERDLALTKRMLVRIKYAALHEFNISLHEIESHGLLRLDE